MLDGGSVEAQTPPISSGGGIVLIKRPTPWAVFLALLASLALAPLPALAQRGGMSRGGGGVVAGQTVGGGAFVGGRSAAGGAFIAGRGPGGRAFIAGQPGARGFVPGRDGFHRHPFFNRGFNSFGPVVVYGGSYAYWPYYYDTSLYNPPVAYSPPPTYVVPYVPPVNGTLSLTPPAPPTPSVVEFPTGRYELRGDGVTEPYRWVWIPKPPTAPPAEPSSPVPPTSGDPGPTRHAPLYRWTDEQGTVHYTDRWTAVPDRYRAQFKRGESS
ncbi:MAG TPA: DUF4124 domain-containing protein [Methylomirabilota bacterium]